MEGVRGKLTLRRKIQVASYIYSSSFQGREQKKYMGSNYITRFGKLSSAFNL